MPCDIEQLLEDGRSFQNLSERAQLIAMAQLLCDIVNAGEQPLTKTSHAIVNPFVFTATRRTTVEIAYQWIETAPGDDTITIQRTGVPDVVLLLDLDIDLNVPAKYQNSFRLSPGDTFTMTVDGSNLTVLSIITYEE